MKARSRYAAFLYVRSRCNSVILTHSKCNICAFYYVIFACALERGMNQERDDIVLFNVPLVSNFAQKACVLELKVHVLLSGSGGELVVS